MEAMISNDDEKAWMTPLLEFRNEFGDEEQDRKRRSFRKMGGFLQGSYGQLHHGPYKKEFRVKWLRRLLEMQVEINANGPEEFSNLELITIPEMRAIRRIWVNEKHEFDDVLPEIYHEVIGKPFPDPEWFGSGTFGRDEWKILQEVCAKLNPNEELNFEMMYSLIDIENRANSLNQRKGILDALEACITHTFYENEDDALRYYMDRLERKRSFGGKYDEKFFAHVKGEGEEFDQETVAEDASLIGDESE